MEIETDSITVASHHQSKYKIDDVCKVAKMARILNIHDTVIACKEVYFSHKLHSQFFIYIY